MKEQPLSDFESQDSSLEVEGIYIILMDSEVPKICNFGGAEFSAIQLTEEVSEILQYASAAYRIKPVFKKLRHSGLEVLKDLITVFS